MKQLRVLQLLPGWDASPSQYTQHEATKSITTPPWMGCLSITGYPQQYITCTQPSAQAFSSLTLDLVRNFVKSPDGTLAVSFCDVTHFAQG